MRRVLALVVVVLLGAAACTADTPNGPPELSPQYYAFANSMVEYLYATYGGKDAYRKLALAFKEDAVPANVFPKVLNVTAAKFYDDWKIAAKKKYC